MAVSGEAVTISPTSRSLKLMRKKRGWHAEKVEQRIQRFTRDLFNCIDVVAMDGATLYGVQITSGSNHAARRTKILAEPLMQRWIESGGRLLIQSWDKQGARGKRKRWTLREEEISLADFAGAQQTKEIA